MGKINKILLMLIAMVAIMIVAVGINKGMTIYKDNQWEKERIVRYEEASASVSEIQTMISELSQDQEAIAALLEEHKEFFEDMEGAQTSFGDEPPAPEEESPEPDEEDYTVSGNLLGTVSGNEFYDVSGNLLGTVSGNEIYNESGNRLITVSGNELRDVSGNELIAASENEFYYDVSGNQLVTVSGNELRDVSGNLLAEIFGSLYEEIAGDETVGNVAAGDETEEGTEDEAESGTQEVADGMEDVWEEYWERQQDMKESSLQEKRQIRTSYIETTLQEDVDRQILEESTIDFSKIKITCIGDSLTEATNLDSMEDYRQYAYPTRLQEILGAERVTNLGIGGSSIGRYWDNAFVDRYKEIPEDTDLIIIFGGANDGFCASETEIGTFEERAPRTFYGDLDELLRGIKENYPDAMVVIATPLPNVLHDMLKKERDYLVPQVTFAEAIKSLAQEYEVPVIDLYNSNILDTHDAAIIYNYMPDGVHCNPEGYEILARHFAAELVKIYEQKAAAEAEQEEESGAGNEQGI